VLSDNRSAAASATRHLLEGGHRRVAYVGARHDVYSIAERRRGYEDELARWNLPLDPALVIEDVERDAARAAVRELLARPDGPDAIFSSQNETTVGVIGGVRDAGLHHDLALVGFDDFPTADLLDPGITVIAQDPERIGSIAAELLFRRIAGEDSPAETIFVPVRLIQRGSGEIAPRP
jgi:LacI family transcriptional regulator